MSGIGDGVIEDIPDKFSTKPCDHKYNRRGIFRFVFGLTLILYAMHTSLYTTVHDDVNIVVYQGTFMGHALVGHLLSEEKHARSKATMIAVASCTQHRLNCEHKADKVPHIRQTNICT